MNSEAFESCKAMTLDFIIKENDPEVAAVEDDVSAKRNWLFCQMLEQISVFETVDWSLLRIVGSSDFQGKPIFIQQIPRLISGILSFLLPSN